MTVKSINLRYRCIKSSQKFADIYDFISLSASDLSVYCSRNDVMTLNLFTREFLCRWLPSHIRFPFSSNCIHDASSLFRLFILPFNYFLLHTRSRYSSSPIAMDYVEKLIRPEQLPHLIEDALDFAHCNGLVIRTAEHKNRSDVCQNAPLALLPSPFPRKLFEQGMNVQLAMNLLYFKISWDSEFLIEAHSDVVHEDEFTRRMVDCYRKATAEGGPRQKLMLLTQRSDYMCHVEGKDKEPQLKQIEVNNIAVSMGGLAQRATLLHRRLLSKLRVAQKEIELRIPDNHPVELLAKALKFNNPKAAVLVVVEDVNQNQCDQRYIEYELERLAGSHLKIIRNTFTQSYEKLFLNENGDLQHADYSDGPIGLVYFRAGYAPDHYHGEREWDARLRMELSSAIKCPWIGLQLANTKKVQQVLAKPGVVERFLEDPDQVRNVRATFAGLWGLERDDEETEAVVRDAIEHPELYVLKPQLEGGGGNFYGSDITEKLRKFTLRERAAHILMQRIKPLVVKVLANRSSGHILRSKAEHVNEGGVAVGAAVIDTPYLF
ncbi:Glutathione synthetase [Aphelenchoides besseyi]|nr:Glutathione synthetase [Aphelenchoides besseyi]